MFAVQHPNGKQYLSKETHNGNWLFTGANPAKSKVRTYRTKRAAARAKVEFNRRLGHPESHENLLQVVPYPDYG